MAADAILSDLPHAERHGVTVILENHYKDGYWEYPEFAQKTDVFLEILWGNPIAYFSSINPTRLTNI